MKKFKKNDVQEPTKFEKMDADDERSAKNTVINLPSKSYILSGRDKEQIHKQNVELLKAMSEKEIVEEREKLMTTMDPAIVAFLKSKRKEIVEAKTQTSVSTISDLNEAGKEIKIEEIKAFSALLQQPEADKWIHFDTVETNKLAWMKDVDIPKKQEDQYEARFDFAGWLMPFSQPELNEKNRILYHHGEEPGRPGYTLQELFQLAR